MVITLLLSFNSAPLLYWPFVIIWGVLRILTTSSLHHFDLSLSFPLNLLLSAWLFSLSLHHSLRLSNSTFYCCSCYCCSLSLPDLYVCSGFHLFNALVLIRLFFVNSLDMGWNCHTFFFLFFLHTFLSETDFFSFFLSFHFSFSL